MITITTITLNISNSEPPNSYNDNTTLAILKGLYLTLFVSIDYNNCFYLNQSYKSSVIRSFAKMCDSSFVTEEFTEFRPNPKLR